MSTKLFVGNLSFNATENQLQDMFAAHGNVLEVDMIMDKFTGRPRGFAFVTMETKEAADAATQALNGTSLDGRALTVNEVLQHLTPDLGQNAFGVELHAPVGKLLVLHYHDFAFVGLSSDLEAIGQRGAVDHQRMIARGRKRIGHAFEQIFAVMLNLRR